MRRFLALFIFFSTLTAQATFIVPRLTGPVVDEADLIRTGDEKLLREWFHDVNARGKAQIQVLTVRQLGGQAIEQASIDVVDSWQLGDKKKDNGILIMVALEERKIRIEVGQGLEGDLPDAVASRIIRETMTPLFQQGSPSQGIVMGAYQVIRAVQPDFNPDERLDAVQAQKESVFGKYEGLFIFLFVLAVLILRAFTGGGRSRFGGGWGGPGMGGGWGAGSGGFGGSGGWSGGGGGFSGGGASGNW